MLCETKFPSERQFVKGKTYSEIEDVRKHLPDIEAEQFGSFL